MSSVSPRFLTAYDVGDWCLRGYTEELQTRARGDPRLTRFHWDELHARNRVEALQKFEENSKQFKQDLVTKAREGLEKNIERELARIVEIYENNQRSEAMKTMLDQSKQSNKEMNTKVGSLAAQDERLNSELYANQQRMQHLNDSYQTAKAQLDMSGLASMRAELEFRRREGDSVEATNRAAEAALHDQNERIKKMMQQLDKKQKKTSLFPNPYSLFSRNSSNSDCTDESNYPRQQTDYAPAERYPTGIYVSTNPNRNDVRYQTDSRGTSQQRKMQQDYSGMQKNHNLNLSSGTSHGTETIGYSGTSTSHYAQKSHHDTGKTFDSCRQEHSTVPAYSGNTEPLIEEPEKITYVRPHQNMSGQNEIQKVGGQQEDTAKTTHLYTPESSILSTENVETTIEESEKSSNNGHQQKLTQKYEIQKYCHEEEITLKIKLGDPFVVQDQNEIPFTGMMQIQNDTFQNILNGQDEITLKMKVAGDFLGQQVTTINGKMHIEKKKSPPRDQQISKAEISRSELLKDKTQDNFGTLLSQIKSGLSDSFVRSFKENN